ncbi:hypothetical protein CERZMDRAFT_101610 [Cercospora zeae-maydis SCOH1-5]|uniref:DUF7605 domain-containing protein n=1 Tax=Cercospora zeae-maydis SCOH1-5 TaxID=717836 RepID=A0A6A6F344_9PEZI|nr:hypothetical protein CERZMDRAFT_101610 [Cercospora zeae-maydis SCOH1-5]
MAEESLFVPQVMDHADVTEASQKRARRVRERNKGKPLGFQYSSEEEEGLTIRLAAYDSRLKNLQDALAQIGSDATRLVPQDGRTELAFAHLLRNASAAASPPAKRKRRIYLVGDSGAGKSSTINCVLGMPNLAMAFGLGESVTRVATSYEGPFASQTRRFAARIVCLSLNEIRAKLRALYKDYCSYQLELADMAKSAQAKASKRSSEDDESFDVRNTKRQASQSAFEVFRSLFCEHPDFEDNERAESFLKVAADGPEDQIIGVFTKWCKSLLPKLTEVSGNMKTENKSKKGPGDQIPVSLFEADTQEELQAQLSRYAASNALSNASLWALVSKIHIGIRGVPILEHAIFVDWPGAGDTNDLRAKASTHRVSDCDEIWIVCHISRVCTNRTVSDALHRYAAAKPCSIVCTHLDANADDSNELEHLKALGFQNAAYKAQSEQRQELETDICNLVEDLTERKDAMVAGNILDDAGFLRKATDEQLQVAVKEIYNDEIDLNMLKSGATKADAILMNLGWDIHRPYYLDKLESMLREMGLKAKHFFVSNEHYMGCKGARLVKGSLLDLPRTGIPDLRRHVLETTAADQMAVMQDHIADVEAFLRGVDVVAAPAHLKRTRDVLLTIERGKGRISDLKHGIYFATLDSAIEGSLDRPVKRQMKSLIATATEMAAEKIKWHPSTLKAFIANAGSYETKKVSRQNWNRTFFAEFRKIVLANWEAFANEETEAFDSLRTAFLTEIRGVVADANKRGAEKRLGNKRGEFRALIEVKIKAVERLCNKTKREYALKLESSKTEATKPGINAQKSYIDKAMDDGYDLCKVVIGRGYRKEVVKLLEGHFAAKDNSSPFLSVVFDLKNAIEDDANAQLNPLIQAVEDVFDDITGWLEGAFAEHAGDPVSPSVRKKLEKWLPGALQRHADIKAQLEEIVKEYGDEAQG